MTAVTDLTQIIRACTPAQLAGIVARLGPDDLSIVERIIADVARSGWRSSPSAMAAKLTQGAGDEFQRFAYTEVISNALVDAVEGRRTRLILNMPARYGKSLLASRWLPVWAFDRNPATKLILASYGDVLANENATFVRDQLVEHSDVLSCQLKPDQRRRNRFVTTEGGGLVAAGIGSALTGFGATGAIVDDPLKNWQEAHSEARRLHVWNWYRSVLRLRLEGEDAWLVVVQTRWHEEDLTGMLVDAASNDDGTDWEVIRLPAICDDPAHDPIGRKLGEPLEPLLFSLRAVQARALDLGSYLSSGLEQQLPAPEEGTDIMRGWWRWWNVLPPKFDDSLTSWDMKLKDKESGDYCVGQVWGRTGNDFWLIDQLRGRYNFPTAKAAIVLLHVRYPWVPRHIVENAGYGPEVLAELRHPEPGYTLSEETRGLLGITAEEVPKVEQTFRRGVSGLLPEVPKGDKRARMRAQSGKIEGGHVHVPMDRGIGELLVNEASAFPNGAYDDQIDALSQALKRLSGGQASTTRPTGLIRSPKPSQRSTGSQMTRTLRPPRR